MSPDSRYAVSFAQRSAAGVVVLACAIALTWAWTLVVLRYWVLFKLGLGAGFTVVALYMPALWIANSTVGLAVCVWLIGRTAPHRAIGTAFAVMAALTLAAYAAERHSTADERRSHCEPRGELPCPRGWLL